MLALLLKAVAGEGEEGGCKQSKLVSSLLLSDICLLHHFKSVALFLLAIAHNKLDPTSHIASPPFFLALQNCLSIKVSLPDPVRTNSTYIRFYATTNLGKLGDECVSQCRTGE